MDKTVSSSSATTRVALLGCGRIGRSHAEAMLQADGTEIVVVAEPSAEAYAGFCARLDEMGLVSPPNVPELEKLLTQYGDLVDVALVGS